MVPLVKSTTKMQILSRQRGITNNEKTDTMEWNVQNLRCDFYFLWKFGLVTTRQSVTISWCSLCWVGKPLRPHIWTSQSEIAYVSGNRCCSHIPRKRGLALGKLLAIDTRDTPDTLTSLWGQIQPRHTHSHTLTQKHRNTISWWCSHTPARALVLDRVDRDRKVKVHHTLRSKRLSVSLHICPLI